MMLQAQISPRVSFFARADDVESAICPQGGVLKRKPRTIQYNRKCETDRQRKGSLEIPIWQACTIARARSGLEDQEVVLR